MAEVVPGFAARFEIDDVVAAIAPRPLLVMSADEDRYSADAPDIVTRAARAWEDAGAAGRLTHRRYPGGHALDGTRFAEVIEWIVDQATWEGLRDSTPPDGDLPTGPQAT